MSEPLPYSEVVKLEQFMWEECMAQLPHALDCAAWIYIVGLNDMSLDDKSCEEITGKDLVLGLEIDFWDELPRVKIYSEDIRRFLQNKQDCIDLFEGFARKFVQKLSDGTESYWLRKSAQIPDGKVGMRPQWIEEWQNAPVKKGWQLPPSDKEEIVLKKYTPPEPEPESEPEPPPAPESEAKPTLKPQKPKTETKLKPLIPKPEGTVNNPSENDETTAMPPPPKTEAKDKPQKQKTEVILKPLRPQ